MENNVHSDELQHHGTKGMRWGIRRYQNKDGSLTPAGQKRYNKEVEKLKKETAKVKAEEKAAAARKKNQAKIDKLESDKEKLEARKKALKDGTDDKKDDDQPTETAEQRRERVLKSTDPKEVYENRNLLSDQELMNRVNRIDLEMRLNSKVPAEEHKKTGMEYLDSARNAIDKTTNLYRSVDNAYSAVANSAIGKTLMKQLGIEAPKKSFNLADFYKNIDKESDQEIANKAKRIKNQKAIEDALKNVGNSKPKEATSNANVDELLSRIEDLEDKLSNKGD